MNKQGGIPNDAIRAKDVVNNLLFCLKLEQDRDSSMTLG